MNAVTIKPVVYAQYRRADGSYGVRLRVTFARASRFISTNVSVYPSQLTRSLKIKDANIERRLDDLVREMRDRAGRLNMFALQSMSIDDIVEYITREENNAFRLDFPSFAREQIKKMGAGARNYTSALHSLCDYIGRESFDIGMLSSSQLRRYEEHLTLKHGKGARAVSLYTQAVAKLHAIARNLYNDEEEGRILIRNPYARYKCPTQAQGKHRNAEPSLIARMLAERETLTGRERLGVDVFLLSFALMGANAPDLYECRIEDGIVLYNRHKTRERRADGAEMRVRIEPCIETLAREYQTRHADGFVFAKRYSTFENFGRAVNIGLHAYAKRIGYAKPLTLYVARHSWATIARSAEVGIDKGVVNDCICHIDAGTRVTDIYAAKDWRVMWDANARVLKLFAW